MKTRARGRFSEATWYRQAAVAESPPTHRQQHYAQQHQRPPLRTSDLGLSTADEQDPQQVGPFLNLYSKKKTERAKNDEIKEQSVSFSKNNEKNIV